MSDAELSILVEIKRKTAALPRYVEIPEEALTTWNLQGTTSILIQIEGGKQFPRNLKRWGKGRPVWFFDLTADQCKRAKIDTGDVVQMSLTQVKVELAAEIKALLKTDLNAQLKWDEKTASQRRMLNEYVLSAKKEETRLRRSKKGLGVE